MSIELRDWVRHVPDYPKPGILFKDLTPLMAHPPAFRAAIDWFTERVSDLAPDAVTAIDARGFIFASPVVDRLGIPLVLVRKRGKLPPPTVYKEYSLEYAEASSVEVRSDAVSAGQRVVIIDDLLATGGTAIAAAELVEELGAIVVSQLFLVELSSLGGRDMILARDPMCEVTSNMVYE